MKPFREAIDFKIRLPKKSKPPIVIDQQEGLTTLRSSNEDLSRVLQKVNQQTEKKPTWRQLHEEAEAEKLEKQKIFQEIPSLVIKQLQKSIKRKEIEVPEGQDFNTLVVTFFSKVKQKLQNLENSEEQEQRKHLTSFQKRKTTNRGNNLEITIEGLEFNDTADEFFEKSLEKIRSKCFPPLDTPLQSECDEFSSQWHTQDFLSTGRSKSRSSRNQNNLVKTQLNLICHQLRDLQSEHLANKRIYRETASREAIVDSKQRKMLRMMDKGRAGCDEFTQEVIHSTNDINKKVLLQIKLEKKAFEQRRAQMKFRTPKNFLKKVQKIFGDQNYFDKNYY